MRTISLITLLVISLNCPALEPARKLSPADVVRFQLDSLRQNMADNEGIASTYRFASPANKRVTGPLSRFSRLFNDPQYAPMLNHQRSDIQQVSNTGTKAVYTVELVDNDGSVHHYRFELSLQSSGACIDCWMTDSVIWSPVPGRSA